MKTLVAAATLVVGHLLLSCSAAFAQDPVLLSWPETRAYHACLFEAWVQDYCRENPWGFALGWAPTYNRVVPACVIANGGGKFPLDGRYSYNTEDYCWNAARRAVR